MKNFNITMGKNDHGRRVDRILRKAFKDVPLSLIHRFIRKKKVCINNVPAKIDSRVQEGDVLLIKGNIEFTVSPAAKIENTEVNTHSDKLLKKPVTKLAEKLDILYEGSGLLILNKPSGLDVHGENSLETMVLAYLAEKLPASLSFKPGPLHRLDKPTSGIIAFSASLEGAQRFSEALQNQHIKKWYLALMDGIIQDKEVWKDMLFRDKDMRKTVLSNERGQNAVMTVLPLCTSSNAKYTFALIELETGRTHQIRAQSNIHHHPLAGDKKYGGSFLAGGFFLHAAMLSIPSGIAPELPVLMTAPIPAEKKSLLVSIFGGNLSVKTQKNFQNSPHLSALNDII